MASSRDPAIGWRGLVLPVALAAMTVAGCSSSAGLTAVHAASEAPASSTSTSAPTLASTPMQTSTPESTPTVTVTVTPPPAPTPTVVVQSAVDGLSSELGRPVRADRGQRGRLQLLRPGVPYPGADPRIRPGAIPRHAHLRQRVHGNDLHRQQHWSLLPCLSRHLRTRLMIHRPTPRAERGLNLTVFSSRRRPPEALKTLARVRGSDR
jgi:hypothetical protein